jgi:hypothetical protein
MDEENTPTLDLNELADLYLTGKTPETDQEEAPDDEEADVEEEAIETSEDEADDDQEEAEKPAPLVADDEADVTVAVDGTNHVLKVKDLKRLFGQEASLTQKSQALSSASKAVEAQSLFIANVLNGRLVKAQAEADKYAKVDLFRASRELEPDEFDALNAAKKNADSELVALTQEGVQFMKNATDSRSTLLRERAKIAIVEIKRTIPEWNDSVYDNVRSYAVGQGMDRQAVNEIVDAGSILMIHKAMQFDAAKAKIAANTKKVVKAATKVMSKSGKASDYKGSSIRALTQTATQSGSIDDVMELYLARQKQ